MNGDPAGGGVKRGSPILAVAADVQSEKDALDLARKLHGLPVWMKVGLELFTAVGPGLVGRMAESGFGVFLDLKFHDIPNTVEGAVLSASRLGVNMLTLHAAGGEAMCRAALAGRSRARASGGPLLVAVTVLTSEGGDKARIRERVLERARMAKACGLDGVVCSGLELAAVKDACGPDFLCVCPGIRFAGHGGGDDQSRVCTPARAAADGADVIVMGRPIVRAEDPAAAAVAALREMGRPV